VLRIWELARVGARVVVLAATATRRGRRQGNIDIEAAAQKAEKLGGSEGVEGNGGSESAWGVEQVGIV
jgi:hypothetical protein